MVYGEAMKTILLPEWLHRLMKRESADLGLPLQEAICDACVDWLRDKVSPRELAKTLREDATHAE